MVSGNTVERALLVLSVGAVICRSAVGAVELTHRWSFNAAADYTDSIGGVVAAKMGTALHIADGKVTLTGTAAKSGSLDLGANLLDADGATIEIWATQNAVRNSSRIFDYGTDSTHYFMLNWTYGTSTYQSWAMALTPNAVTNVYTPTGPYLLGTPYHFAVTFAKSGTKTYVRWTKRLAQTGGLPIAHDITTKEALSTFSNPHLYLGASHSDGVDANASYDEVRIWKGVLSDEQLAANAIAGPDAVATNGVSAQGSAGFSIAPGTRFVIGSSAQGSFLRSDLTGRFLTTGTVKIGSGAKIVFDTSEHRVPTLSFSAAGFTLPADAPAGATVLDYVETTDAVNYGAPTLSGNTITVSLVSGMPATAYWTGGRPTSADDLANAANWKCYDAAGSLMNGAVPGAATTVVITNATTAFTVPNGVTPAWKRIRLGAERTVSQWGKKSYGVDRYANYGMYGTEWMIPIGDYTCNGTISDPSVIAQGVLEKSQLRMDGWFYVAAANAGYWKIYQNVTFDDYSALAIDGEWVFHDIGYRYKLSSYCNVAEGWHRYTVICGDTFGGYTGKSGTGNLNYYVTRPKSGGGTENVQFKPTNFTFGSAAPSTIKLTDDCNWGAFGTVTLSNGTVLDLNGHSLVVEDVDSDYVGTTVTNSSTSSATLYTACEPAQSGVSNLCVAARVTRARSSVAYTWTGEGGDAKFSTLENWRLLSGATPSVAPAAGDMLVFAAAGGGVASNDLVDIGGAIVRFPSGAGAFTICGNPFTGVQSVINDSSSIQTFSNAVTFADTYLAIPSVAAVRFPGGATATYPDPSLRSDYSDARYRTLYGNFTFTQNWSVPGNNSWERPWVIPSGTSVSGKKFTGTQGSFKRTLQINAGGTAHFTEMEMGWNRGDFECKGTLVIDGLYVHLVSSSETNTGVSNIGRTGSTGTLYANKIEKRFYSYLTEFITHLVVGSGGIRLTQSSYHPMTFDADTTIRAADDFGILTDFAGDGTDFHGLSLSGHTITINTEDESGTGHTVTFGTSVRAGGGVLRKIGAGTLVMQDGDLASKTGFVKRYTGGTVVEAGTLCVKSDGQLGSGSVTLHPGATLEVTDGVTFANNVVGTAQGGGTIRVNGAVTLAGGASWHAGGYDFADGAVVTVAPRTTDGVIASGLTPADTNHFTTASGRLVLSDDGELTYADSFVWIGPDGGSWSDAANWSHNGVVGDAAPVDAPSAFVEFANDAPLSVALDTSAACCRLVFGGAGAVTVANPDASATNAFTLYRVTGTGAAANRLECRVDFTEAYNVNLDGVLDFAGGATATKPGADTFASVHNRTLTGNVAFTNGWTFPRQTSSSPIVVTSGSTLTGTSYNGNQNNWWSILNVQSGATASFNSFEIGWDRGFIQVNGVLEVANDFTIVASGKASESNLLGWYGDTGLLRAGGLAKTRSGRSLLYVPRYEIGARGVRSTDNESFAVTNDVPVTMTATADMGFYKGTNKSAQVVYVFGGAALALDLGSHTVTNVNLVGGGGTLAVAGTGTATYNAVGGPAAVSVGSGATLNIAAGVAATNAMA
ncbi:MAG: hypothetical protein IJ658_01275, partial [Kiritimatiellae bacterium]|nr:hypothetical protein [Kiritimatiellia bacterium]